MKKYISKLIIGIPALLLIIVLILSGNEIKTNSLDNDFNPYLKQLPQEYSLALSNSDEIDSSFFSSTLENFALRKLLIFKANPSDKEVKSDFIIELYPSNNKYLKNNSQFLDYRIVNDAVLFNYNKKKYGVFKIPLPLIDIEKLVIKQISKNKKTEPWVEVIEKPFKELDKNSELPSVEKGMTLINSNPYSFLFTKMLKKYDISVIPSSNRVKNDSLFKTYQSIESYASSEGKTIGKVTNPKVFWKMVNTKDESIKNRINFIGKDSSEVNQLITKFIKEELPFEGLFNVNKLAFFNALNSVFTKNCNEEIQFLYNKEENNLEPFYINSKCLGLTLAYLQKSDIEDHNYLKSYTKALFKVSQLNLYEEIINNNLLFKKELILINSYETSTVFDFDIIKANQRVIRKSLNPSSALKSELISIDKDRMVLSVFNTSNYPINILELSHNNKKTITNIDPDVEISSNEKDTIILDLSQSFENLFVSKKKKVVGFILPKHIYELGLKYRISGVDKTYASSIIPYQKTDNKKDDLFRTPAYINNHKDIIVDEGKKEIRFSKDSVVISAPLVIQKDYTFKLKPGDIINIIEGGKIISHSPLSFLGTSEKPIKVYSSDKRGQGLLVLSEQRRSTLKNVVFDQLRNPSHGSWSVTGSVTFYESPVDLKHVSVMNNKCEDALNIVRAKFTMNQVVITNTQSDAFDGDFVQGTISNCHFDSIGNDAIDVSGSDLTIKNVTISNAGDKGLSAGENSKMNIDTVEISSSEIAVAGKDLSIVDAKNLKISNTKLGFTAFQKKPEFGPSKITVNGVSMTGIETKYLIESSSSLFVDNKKIETTQNVKDRMYGVEFGRSSEETRNTPQ